MVGEGPVEFEVQGDEVQREAVEDGGDGVSAHAVAGIDDDLEGADGGEVDQALEVVGVPGEGVLFGDGARDGVGGDGGGALVGPLLDEFADGGEAGVLAHGVAPRGRA